MFPLILLLALGQTPEPAPPTFGALIITASNDYAAYQDALAKSGSADHDVIEATDRAKKAKELLEAKAEKLKVTMEMLNNMSPAKPSLPTVTKPLTVAKPELSPPPKAVTDVVPAPPVRAPPKPHSHIVCACTTNCIPCESQKNILEGMEAEGYQVSIYTDVPVGGGVTVNGQVEYVNNFPQVWIIDASGNENRLVAGKHEASELKALAKP